MGQQENNKPNTKTVTVYQVKSQLNNNKKHTMMNQKTRLVGTVAAAVGLGARLSEAHPCYSLHEQHCIEDPPGDKLSGCLRKANNGAPGGCLSWLDHHDECKTELSAGGVCAEYAYTQDAVPCLRDWNFAQLSDGCKALVQKTKEAEEAAKPAEPELSKKEQKASKKRQDERRKVREEAVRRAKAEKDGPPPEQKKKKSKKAKKAPEPSKEKIDEL